MEKTFEADARNLAFHLANLARDYDKEGYNSTASDLRQASLTIKILLNSLAASGAFNKMKG